MHIDESCCRTLLSGWSGLSGTGNTIMTASVHLFIGPTLGPLDSLDAVLAEFPTVMVENVYRGPGKEDVVVNVDAWCRGTIDLYRFDGEVDERADRGILTLYITGECPDNRGPDTGQTRFFPSTALTALEVLTRCQRRVDRRNAHSSGPGFDRILALHRQLHDLAKPLVRADYAHALDVWQWLLRLCSHADEAVQIAALFHDIERLAAEADRRIEHLANDYDQFKHAHARGGAAMTQELLRTLGIDSSLRARVGHLIERHERPPGPDKPAPDLTLLNNADGLSFFSLNSAGFLDYYGQEHTRRKILWTLARLGAQARTYLPQIRLRPDVAQLFSQSLADAPAQHLPPRRTNLDRSCDDLERA